MNYFYVKQIEPRLSSYPPHPKLSTLSYDCFINKNSTLRVPLYLQIFLSIHEPRQYHASHLHSTTSPYSWNLYHIIHERLLQSLRSCLSQEDHRIANWEDCPRQWMFWLCKGGITCAEYGLMRDEFIEMWRPILLYPGKGGCCSNSVCFFWYSLLDIHARQIYDKWFIKLSVHKYHYW